jgi:PDZ domain-containing protein
MLVSGGVLVALVLVAMWLPVPYVLLRPGPTFDTTGEFDGTQLITIDGATTYPADGQLRMTTVSESGGPFGDLTLVEALWGWWSPSAAVMPERLLYPPDADPDEVREENDTLFVDSQSSATAAALDFLDLPTRVAVVVAGVAADGPSEGQLEPGDEILTINGVDPKDSAEAAALIGRSKPGSTIVFEVDRDGKELTKKVVSEAGEGANKNRARVGITVNQSVQGEDVTITYGLEEVGGPSAGLMFSLGIIDELTDGGLAGGRVVAGTGTITDEGVVGPIGGIQQKVVGAKRDGATYFLAPAANCADAVGAAPDGLTLVRVETLDGAVDALEKIDAGKVDDVPRC